MQNIKITVFTGTRAEYGLLYWLINDINEDKKLTLQLLVSGSHLSPEFGLTYTQILDDGFHIDEKVEMLVSSNSPMGTAKSMGLGVLGYADALERLSPDLIVILGDRYEALAVAQTSLIMGIPILHLHGGEASEGANDDAFRHAITKLSNLHATSTDSYRKRVIQLGESPDRVVNVGAMGLDYLQRGDFLNRNELSASLKFDLSKPFFVVTYHPVTLGDEDPIPSCQALLEALEHFHSHQVIFTYPNADDGGREIIPLIESYASSNPGRVLAIPSLGQIRYLSAVKYADAVIGNSSSGVIEVPSFDVPTVNVGVRQQGRLAAKSVLHCSATVDGILEAIALAVSRNYKKEDEKILNPYGQGNASLKVIKMIKSFNFSRMKVFYDLES
jgi:UDP-N-acetylglucosamine 2-epimerase (non-hydrolysing)|tara:strand:- start:4373 stop:5533 length:1161 start_codon:yes stop_codon:yes gene_type:complete